MGFEPNRVEWALKSTGGGLQGALDHLEAHQDEPMPENWNQPDSMAAPSDEAKVRVLCLANESIRCNQCQKLFRDMDLAMYHADKSGHEDFAESSEEIKPLTEEEKQQRLAERMCSMILLIQYAIDCRKSVLPRRASWLQSARPMNKFAARPAKTHHRCARS